MQKYVDAVVGRIRPVRALGPNEVQSHEGGIVNVVDDWTRLTRWLILGSAGGTYYVDGRGLTVENVDAVKRCLAADSERTVKTIAEISVAGRAPKNEPAILALVVAMR